jgi:hypothetical protein
MLLVVHFMLKEFPAIRNLVENGQLVYAFLCLFQQSFSSHLQGLCHCTMTLFLINPFFFLIFIIQSFVSLWEK